MAAFSYRGHDYQPIAQSENLCDEHICGKNKLIDDMSRQVYIREMSHSPVPTSPTSGTDPSRDDVGDIVQFTSSLYYVEEVEGYLTIDVMRMGSLQGPVSVLYETGDASATAGVDYFGQQGQLTFATGESGKEIRVDVVDNDTWRTTLDFKVRLFEPDRCQLGQYLHTCRVKVIDNTFFPSDVFKYEMEMAVGRGSVAFMDVIQTLNPRTLFWEFCKLVFTSSGVGCTTVLVALLDQVMNLYYLLLAFTSVYLVNTALNIHDPEAEDRLLLPTRIETIYAVAAVYVAPMLVLHLWACIRVNLNLKGRIVAFLRINLFRKYLNYSEESREQTDIGVMTLELKSGVEALATGYMTLLDFGEVLGRMIISWVFGFYTTRSALPILIALPGLTVMWCICRECCKACLKGPAGPTDKLLSFTHDVAVNYVLVEEYGKRPGIVDGFTERAWDVCSAVLEKDKFMMNTEFVLKWLGPLMTALYICLEGPNVVSGDETLGAFLAFVKIIKDSSGDCIILNKELSILTDTVKPLQRITMFFNLPTDLIQRKALSRIRREVSKMRRQEAINSPMAKSTPVKADLLQIEVTNLSYNIPGTEKALFRDISLTVDQGQFIAVTGDHRRGKNTMLKLLSMKIFPTQGQVIVPMHLRTLYVSQEPLMMSLTAYHNLIFGVADGRTPDHQRIESILHKLGMSTTLEFVKEDLLCPGVADTVMQQSDEKGWIESMSRSEKCMFHLARALIANPEIILLEKPFKNYEDALEQVVWDALTEHKENRGFCMPPLKHKHLRRPRTVFYSTTERRHALGADVVWYLKGTPDGTGSYIEACSPDTFQNIKPSRLSVNRGTSSFIMGMMKDA